YDFEGFGKAKAEGIFEFGQVPAVEIDGVVYTQSQAILRSLGKKHGYYSEDPITMWKIDSTIDGLEDTFRVLAKAIWNQNKEEAETQFADAYANTLPKFYGVLETRL